MDAVLIEEIENEDHTAEEGLGEKIEGRYKEAEVANEEEEKNWKKRKERLRELASQSFQRSIAVDDLDETPGCSAIQWSVNWRGESGVRIE